MKIILGIILCGFVFLMAGCASYGQARINKLTANERYRLGIRVDRLEGLKIIMKAAKPVLRNRKRIVDIPVEFVKNTAKAKKGVIKEDIAGGKAAGKTIKTVAPAITGNLSVIPAVSVNYVRKPLWYIFSNLNEKTGYVFFSKGINLGKIKTIIGKYNMALILSLMGIKNAKINPYKKEIHIWR
ncbi:MAG: hypothetical protein ACYDDB_01250 [bacterium]